MGLINPDLTGNMYGGDLKPVVEAILREMNGNLNNDNISDDFNLKYGQIGGWSIGADKIYYNGVGSPSIQTAATVGSGSTGVIMDEAGLRGYDSVLGNTFNLPVDGSAPTFASGIINYTTFNVNTNAVIRTSATVGDGTVNSAGLLMNNTGFYATQASQLLANANVKILVDGSASFSGTVTAGAGAIGGWALGTTSIKDVAGVVGLSSAVTGGDDIRFFAGHATPSSAPFRVTESGALTATSATISGSLTATTGAIGGWTINSTSIYTGTEDHSGYTANAGDLTIYSNGTDASIHAKNFYIDTNGDFYSVSGAVGGWTIGATSLTFGSGANTVGIDSGGTNPAIYAGSATPASAPFRVTKAGAITATSGTIGGFTITSTELYGSTIKTAATVGVGSTGVIMDTNGLRGYDSVLGNTFNLPTDGSAPTFSSGIINTTIFNVSTSGVIRTSATVGDGSASSAGILINNTALYACEANQTLANANVKILTTGSASFKGAVTATSGTFTGITAAQISVGNTGYISGGGLTSFDPTITYNDVSTDYDDATVNYGGSAVKGFFLGYDTDDYKILIGDPGANRLSWNGSQLLIIPGTGSVIDGQFITDATIANAKISSLSADKITAGTIDASTIRVINLNASEINAGTINADLITTGTINASLATITNLDAGNITAGTLTGRTVQTSSSGQRLVLDGQTNKINIYDGSGSVGSFYGDNGYVNIDTVSGLATSYDLFVAKNFFLGDIGADGTAYVEHIYCNVEALINGNLDVNGTKNFNIPHPTKEGKRLVYSCPESPEVLVMCRGKKGEEIPQHFHDISEPDTLEIIDGKNGNWLATAVRKGYLNRNPEQDQSVFDDKQKTYKEHINNQKQFKINKEKNEHFVSNEFGHPY